jgi:LysM repeat protein
MNPDLLSSNVSMVLMVLLALALLAHLSRVIGVRRYFHLAQAASVAGLLYFLGENAFGWRFLPTEALFGLFAALFAAVAATAIVRRIRNGEAGFHWRVMLIEMGAMAYLFGPAQFWKPPVSAVLAIFFAFELIHSLKGSESAPTGEEAAGKRPPLFPPKRIRGAAEFATTAAALVFVYVFAMGTGKAPETPPPEAQTAAVEPPAEPEVAAEPPADSATQQNAAAPKDETGASPAPEAKDSAPEPQTSPKTYSAAAGDTLKSIARKLYGKADKWRVLAEANSGIKPTTKLKAGQAIKLPPAATP